MIVRKRAMALGVALASVFGGRAIYAADAAPSVTMAPGLVRDSSAIDTRLKQILQLFTDTTMSCDTILNAEMLSVLPCSKLRDFMTVQLKPYGIPTGTVSIMSKPAPRAVEFRADFDKGYAIPIRVSVEETSPHRINGLYFGSPIRLARTFDDLVREMRVKYPLVSFLAARLNAEATITPVAVADPDSARAIGSAFKLYILAEALRQIDAGTLHWDDVVHIDSARRSAPSGILQNWPANAPVTVQTLATLMISQSDNTATDLLLHHVGRANVEAMQQIAGHRSAGRNMPFLSTREFFALKSLAGVPLRARYIAGDRDLRRTMLDTLGRFAYDQLAPSSGGNPVAIEDVEWFASASDLARVMAWIFAKSERGTAATGREILAVNPGVRFPKSQWQYVGFKGGSEPGVLNGTFLLQRVDGAWYIIVLTANDPAKTIDTSEFFGNVQRAAELLSAQK